MIMDNQELLTFVNVLEKFPVLLNKSKLPEIKAEKKNALEELSRDFSASIGKVVDTKQCLKKVNNLKARVKEKSDIKRTGNRPISLLAWETKMLQILKEDTNPVFNQVAGESK